MQKYNDKKHSNILWPNSDKTSYFLLLGLMGILFPKDKEPALATMRIYAKIQFWIKFQTIITFLIDFFMSDGYIISQG